MKDNLTTNVPDEAQSPAFLNVLLSVGILDILRSDWGNRTGEFEAYWFGYDELKDQLHENGIMSEIKDIKLAMKDLSKQNKVELRPTYNDEWVLSGRGWFACL